ncbi:(d)CMP kinase [Candidatus Rhabdochlamydia porcellionis]|jgi:CMP/dCMP kinase|uniref:Cytidylate kinase n=1 Tax=Candidatus Rhabdochlamydia porcellionis TaxID=225148 RepID=A0ABX8Z166_9BACT|nr:(d)CMP kinase [Candidatus Rhabdochlamydia porcellionis]QZA58277.1 Cytidylate kinase [Candidatus Rhabdochlamydia porcellionis]
MIITIDGPAATGKTSVSRQVAKRLHFTYFDTGAMYRAFTWFFLKSQIAIQQIEEIKKLVDQFPFRIETKEHSKRYFVGDKDVTEEIRSHLITSRVSEISAIDCVRSKLLDIQRQYAIQGDFVFEGRDLGTVVFPQAEIKIFLTADPRIRAERRLAELLAQYPKEEIELVKQSMLADLLKRDHYDSTRSNSPLKCPPDAYKIDTSTLTLNEVVDQIIQFTTEKYPEKIP